MTEARPLEGPGFRICSGGTGRITALAVGPQLLSQVGASCMGICPPLSGPFPTNCVRASRYTVILTRAPDTSDLPADRSGSRAPPPGPTRGVRGTLVRRGDEASAPPPLGSTRSTTRCGSTPSYATASSTCRFRPHPPPTPEPRPRRHVWTACGSTSSTETRTAPTGRDRGSFPGHAGRPGRRPVHP